MGVLSTSQEAVQAANRVAQEPTAHAQRLAALVQLQRHVEGLIAKVSAEAGNPPASSTGD